MRDIQAQNMDISVEEIIATFGRINAAKAGDSLHGSIYQVLFLPSQLDEPASKTAYTAFCPFTGIIGRGPTVLMAYKSWLAEASVWLSTEIRSQILMNDNLQIDDLTSRKLAVGEIPIAPKAPLAPVFVIDFGGEREVVICPYKSEIGTAEKNSHSPILSCDGKEMKVPGFLVDQRITCTKIRRFGNISPLANSI
jgi:hypothetical protein